MLYNLCKNPIQLSSENKEKNHRKKETGEKLPANIQFLYFQVHYLLFIRNKELSWLPV